jgi:hypothetical protein
VNSAVVYGASTLNVYGTSNLSTAVIVGKQGVTALNVTGNAYISNAVTTTNVFAAMANISTTNTQVLSVTTNMTFTGPLATLSNLTVPGNANIEYLSVSNLSVTGNLYVTATNVQTTNALTINNSGTMTALKVVQYEPTIHTHNVAEFWDATRLAMVIDPDGNVAIHTVSSPGYALTVTDPANFETLYIRGKSDQTTLDVTGNLYVSNALTTTNVFATRYYGDAGFMSNISSSSIVQPFANLVVSNALTTTNVFVSNGLDVGPGTLGSNVVVFSNVSGGANTFVMDSNARVSIGAGAFGGGSLLSFGRPFANKILTLYDVGAGDNPSTATNFYGFGIGTNLLRYQVASAANHGFYGASSEYARITSTGVSILTGANPTSNLQVSGNAYISNALTTTNVFTTNVTVTTITGSTANTVTIASNVTTFQSNGAATVMTLTNGRVGIGTTNPQNTLQVQTSGNGNGVTISGDTNTRLSFSATNTGISRSCSITLKAADSSDKSMQFWNNSTDITAGTDVAYRFLSNTTSQLMSITNAGNVGIGTTNPGSQLTMYSGTSNNAIDITGTTQIGLTGRFTAGGYLSFVITDASHPEGYSWRFQDSTALVNGGLFFRVKYSSGDTYIKGNLGIGTTSPGAALDVYGTVNASFTTGCITNSGGSLNLNAGVNAVYFSTLGAVRVYVNASSMAPNVDNTHTCGAGGNRWVSVWSVNGTIQTSDSRHKDSAPLGYGLSEILQANTIMYSWKTQASLPDTDPEKNFKYFGVCADELVSVMPELCYAENPDVPIQINYSELIPVCMNAIKELSAENAQLKARLESLETRFTAAGF